MGDLVKQNWKRKHYVLWCADCGCEDDLFVIQPPRKCPNPDCRKTLKKVVVLI
jgi:hypothetical protein